MWFIKMSAGITQNNVCHTTSLGVDGLPLQAIGKSADAFNLIFRFRHQVGCGVSVDCPSPGVGIPAQKQT